MSRSLSALNVAQAILTILNLFVAVRFLQYGFINVFWRKKGIFKWHIVSGTLLTVSLPYFSWYLAHLSAPPLLVCTLAGALHIVIGMTGVRMIVLFKKRDIRIRRYFFSVAAMSVAVGFAILSYVVILLRQPGWILVSRLFAGLDFACVAIVFLLTLLELIAASRPISGAKPEDHAAADLQRLSVADLVRVFHLRGEGETSLLYSANGPLVGALIVTLPILIVCVPGLLIPYHLMIHDPSVLWGEMSRILEVNLSAAIVAAAFTAWGFFEATLSVRGRVGRIMSVFVIFPTLIVPNIVVVLCYLALAGASLRDALLAGMLFRR